MSGGIVKGGLTPKMILDDVFFNFPTPIPIHFSPLSADDSFVDQLLNFNNFDPIQPPQFQQQQQFNNNCTLVVNSQQHVPEDKDKDSSFLSLPIHNTEEAELEWLSHFVDDSFSPYSTPFPPGYVPKPEREPERKRTRAGRWVRPTSKSDSSPPPKKKVRKQSGKGNRTCRHCGTKKTPQWRGGPNGPNTLCNACGVRFKEGRLLPEYRPASSPSYKSEVHSNSHRKVMEMRMVKGGLTPKMILDDVFFNFPTPFPIHSSPLSAHDSFVDQPLNFNNFDPIQPPQFQQQQQLFNNNCTVVVNSQQHVIAQDKDKDSSFLSLPIHNTQEAELEWLSPFPPGYVPKPEPEPDKHEREPERKRTRTGRWVRPTSKSASSPPPKKQVRKESNKETNKESDKEVEQRTCRHCGTEKTPLWRSGPNGPKTLCNACGVRFKKGRLLPEYRPASSPSYSSELHSNLHRKVIEMRMVKEEEAGP